MVRSVASVFLRACIAMATIFAAPTTALAQDPLTILGPARPVSQREAALLVRVPQTLGDTSLLVISNDPVHSFAQTVESPIAVSDTGGGVYVYVIDNTINGPLEEEHATLLGDALSTQVEDGNRVGIRIVDHAERLGASSLAPTRDAAALRSFLTQNLDGNGTRSPIYTVVERAVDDLASVVRDADHYEVVLVSDGRSEDFGGSDGATDELNQTIAQITRKALAAGIPVSIFAIDRERVQQQTQLQHLTRMQQLAAGTGGLYQPNAFATASDYLASHRELASQMGRTFVAPYPCVSGTPTSPSFAFTVAESAAGGTPVGGGALSATAQVASTFVFCNSVAALHGALSGEQPEEPGTGSGSDEGAEAHDQEQGPSEASGASGGDEEESDRDLEGEGWLARIIDALLDGGPALWVVAIATLGLLVAGLVFWFAGRNSTPMETAPSGSAGSSSSAPPQPQPSTRLDADGEQETVVDGGFAPFGDAAGRRDAVPYVAAPTPLRLHTLRSLWSQQPGFCVALAQGRTLQETLVPVAGVFVGRTPSGAIEVTLTRTGHSQLRFRAADNSSVWVEPVANPVLRDGLALLATPVQVPPGSFFDLGQDSVAELRMLALGGRHEFGDGNRADQWRLVRTAVDRSLAESFSMQTVSTVVGRAPDADASEIGFALSAVADAPGVRHVSATHARVWVSGGIPFVLDESSNGTFVNGERIAARSVRALRQGDEIGFGREALYRVTRVA